MGISVPFDDLVNRLFLSRSRIVELGSGILHNIPGLSSLIGKGSPSDGQNQIDEQPKVIKTSWGEEIGYLVYMDSFPRRYFSDSAIALIDYADRRNKEIHKGEDRKMGGVYDNHPLDMILREHTKITIEIAPVIASIMGLRIDEALAMFLDPRFYIAGKRHDDPEDHESLKTPLIEFKTARKKAIEKDSTLIQITHEYLEMMDWRDTVKRVRAELINQEYEQQTTFVNSLGLPDNERSKLLLDSDFAMGVVDWSTRHIEENFFTQSMFRLHQLYTLEDYMKDGRGGPFQAKLMDSLKSMNRLKLQGKKLVEPMDYMLLRVYVRALDRVVQSKERKPRYTIQQAKEMERLFSRYSRLREVYGELKDENKDGIQFRIEQGMSRPELLDILYRNDIVLSNMDAAINRYGKAVALQQKTNPIALGYLLAILRAREILIAENYLPTQEEDKSTGIITELKPTYKKDLGRKAKEIEDYVASLPPQEFEIVTGEGPISNGFRYETGMRTNVENSERQIAENYDDVLRFERLNRNFSNPQRNIADIRNVRFNLFVIGGLKDGISFDMHPKPYRRV